VKPGNWESVGLFVGPTEVDEVSKRHYVENIDDMDESVLAILGNRVGKIAENRETKDRFRERRAADGSEGRPQHNKIKRGKDRLQ
jgi:hypothetical protein